MLQERKKWSEPGCLFEHMVVVGIHPQAETQGLEAALLKRRTWERDLDAPEHLRDVMRQKFQGTAPPVPDPEVSYLDFIICTYGLIVFFV